MEGAKSTGKDFEWIVLSQDGPQTVSGAARKRIRTQAMRGVASRRKQSGTYGQHNRLQIPVNFSQSESVQVLMPGANQLTAASNDVDASDYPEMDEQGTEAPIAHAIPGTGLEVLSMKYGIGIDDLSGLTSIHVNRAASHLLSVDPCRLVHLLRLRKWSYFSFIPSMYGHSPCLDGAIHCLMANVRQAISPACPFRTENVVSLYVHALKSLQEALDNPVSHLSPDVLCAAEILTLFEILNPSAPQAWVTHAAGTARLIKARGPFSYKTEFEKALFLAQAGPIFTEALLSNEECFLELDIWQNVFRSTILPESVSYSRSEVPVSLWSHLCRLPAIFKQYSQFICPRNDTEGLLSRDDLVSQAQSLLYDLKAWYERFNAQNLHAACVKRTEQVEYLRFEINGVYLVSLTILNRLLSSVLPAQRFQLEEDALASATTVLQMSKLTASINPSANFYIAQKMMISQITIDTHAEWSTATEDIIQPHKYFWWCKFMGRKICHEEHCVLSEE